MCLLIKCCKRWNLNIFKMYVSSCLFKISIWKWATSYYKSSILPKHWERIIQWRSENLPISQNQLWEAHLGMAEFGMIKIVCMIQWWQLSPAPQSIVALGTCKCTTGCLTQRCQCKKNCFVCFELCHCK